MLGGGGGATNPEAWKIIVNNVEAWKIKQVVRTVISKSKALLNDKHK